MGTAVSPPRVRVRWLVAALPALAWLAGAGMLLRPPADPSAFDATASEYGRNWPGDLASMLLRSGVEAALLVLVLRPWSFRLVPDRVLPAAALATALAVLHLVVGLHGGPVIHAHELWLVLLSAVSWAVVVGLVIARRAAAVPRRSSRRAGRR